MATITWWSPSTTVWLHGEAAPGRAIPACAGRTGGLGISQHQELAVAGIAAGQGLYTRVNHHF
jgi:hypothetical protein